MAIPSHAATEGWMLLGAKYRPGCSPHTSDELNDKTMTFSKPPSRHFWPRPSCDRRSDIPRPKHGVCESIELFRGFLDSLTKGRVPGPSQNQDA